MAAHVDTDEDDDLFERPTAAQYGQFFDAICDLGLGEPRYRATIAGATLKTCRALHRNLCGLFPLGDHATAKSRVATLNVEVVASDSLSGGPYPCSTAECRAPQAELGARFAALYADHIVIRDPLAGHSDDDRESLLAVMEVLYRWRPLFEAGIASHVVRLCSHCAATRLQRLSEVPPSLPRFRRHVASRFSKGEFTIRRIDRRSVCILVREPNIGLAHNAASVTYEGSAAEPFLKILARRDVAPLSIAKARATGVLSQLAEPIVRESLMQQLHRTRTSPNAHYASNIRMDLDLASSLAPVAIRWPQSLLDALAHTVPLVGHALLADIVRFRLEDPPAFERYRNHIRALSQVTHDQNALLEAAQTLKSDLASLEQTLRASRSGLWKKARNELLLFGSIGVGLAGTIGLTWLLPLLGGAAVRTVGDVVRPRIPEEVQKHPLYFLWQLKEKA